MSDPELMVLVDQLDELLSEGVDDPEEALEIAALAGMIERARPGSEALEAAVAWRDGPGASLLAEAWDLIDPDAYVEEIDGLVTGEASDEDVEEAVLDFDELMAAASWCNRAKVVRAAAAEVERTVRMAPEVFASLAQDGRELARSPAVAQQLDLYGFWLAIADADAEGRVGIA